MRFAFSIFNTCEFFCFVFFLCLVSYFDDTLNLSHKIACKKGLNYIFNESLKANHYFLFGFCF